MKKLSNRTIVFGLLAVLTALVLTDFYVWQHTRAFFISEVQENLSKSMTYAKSQFNLENLLREDSGELKQFSDQVKSTTGFRTTIMNRQGRVLADSEIPVGELNRVENHLGREEVQLALSRGKGIALRKSATIYKKLIYYCEPLKQNGLVVGFLRFALFSAEFDRKMSVLRAELIRLNLVLFFLAVLGLVIYGYWLDSHFKKLRLLLVQQREKENPEPLPRQAAEEFDLLAADVNALLARQNKQLTEWRQGKNQLINIFNSLGEGVAAFDAAGSVLVHNQSFSRILQLTDSSLTGKPFYEILHFPPLVQDIEKHMKSGETVKSRTKYFQEKYIEYEILSLVAGTPATAGFVLAVRDVTHLQKLETIRSDFVANVTHEFKTPLTSIRGFAETLLTGTGSRPDVQEKFLKKILNQTQRLENLVMDLLQLSRLEKQEFDEFMEMDPFPLVEEIADEFRLMARARRLNFFSEIDRQNTGVSIRANANLLRTLLSNLLTNAIQYNREEGSIWLRVQVEERRLRIEVEDTGIGIGQEEQQRIFERFYRTDKARQLSAEGSGLGLAIIRHAVELLGGTCWVQSTINSGSTFRVEIPLLPAK